MELTPDMKKKIETSKKAALERKHNPAMRKFKPLPPPSEQRNVAAFDEFVLKHSAIIDELCGCAIQM